MIEVKSRFGNFKVNKSDILHFPQGIISAEHCKKFALLNIDSEAPFLLLQAIEDEKVNFLVTNPLMFMEDYTLDVSEAELNVLSSEKEDDIVCLTILTVPEGFPESSHLFLLAPILFDIHKRIGIQAINVAYEGDKAIFKLPLENARQSSDVAAI